MAKRQLRLKAAEVAERLASLVGRKVSLVLRGRQVYEGNIRAVKEEYLLIENGLQQIQRFRLESIEEVIVETHT